MASPIAHSFAGLWTFLAAAGRSKLISRWREFLPKLCMLVLVANAADLDIIAEVITGKDLHRGFSHSLLAAVLVTLICTWLWEIAGDFRRSAALYFAAYASHLLIDIFTGTDLGWTHSGSGVPLLWPCGIKFSSPLILIYGVEHRKDWSSVSAADLWQRGYELLVFGGITIGLLAWRRWYLRKTCSGPDPG
jgi:inner membrane protein